MILPALVLVAASVLTPLAPAHQQDAKNPPAKEQAEASAKKVKELKKERIVVLKAAAEISAKMAQACRIDAWEAMEDRMALLKAELEAADTDADRITLYKSAVESLKLLEDVAKARYESGRGNELAVLRVKARRLDVEVLLEQVKSKEAKEGK